MDFRGGGQWCGTHDVELDGLDGGKVDDLKFLCLCEVEGSEVFGQASDALGGLQPRRLIVSSEVLDGLVRMLHVNLWEERRLLPNAPRPRSCAGSPRL